MKVILYINKIKHIHTKKKLLFIIKTTKKAGINVNKSKYVSVSGRYLYVYININFIAHVRNSHTHTFQINIAHLAKKNEEKNSNKKAYSIMMYRNCIDFLKHWSINAAKEASLYKLFSQLGQQLILIMVYSYKLSFYCLNNFN